MKTKILLRKLSKLFPKKIAKKYYDFPGLQVGKLKEEVNTIFLCLDFDDITYTYLEDNNLLDKIDLIITHHPFIFGTYKKVLNNDEIKNKLTEKVLKDNLCIYSYHTNFDEGKNGMNDALAEALELENVKSLENDPMARGGTLKKSLFIDDFCNYVKERLDVDYGLLLNYGVKEIKSVAIVGGGGWHSFKIAKDENYDIFISGDMPHHARRDVVLNKYNYLDLPHEIEKIFTKQFKKILLEIEPNLNVITIDHEELPRVV